MPYFQFQLNTPAGTRPSVGAIHFPDFYAAYLAIVRDLPGTASDLMAARIDPGLSSYLISDEHGVVLDEVPVSNASPVTPPPLPRADVTAYLTQARSGEATRARTRVLIRNAEATCARSLRLCDQARALCAAGGGAAGTD